MKNIENNYDIIQELIRKDTGISINNLIEEIDNKELKDFIYLVAYKYCNTWKAISYLEEIQRDYITCINPYNKMKTIYKVLDIIIGAFEQDASEYSEVLECICNLMIKENKIFSVLKKEIPALEKIRKMLKINDNKRIDLEPIYEELSEFYFTYKYKGDVNKFIDDLNDKFAKITDMSDVMKRCCEQDEESYW